MAYSEINEENIGQLLIEQCDIYTHNEATLKDGSEILNEAVWEKIKYLLSKTPRYKVNGKFTGRKATDKEWAAKVQYIIANQANIEIKKLDELIKKTDPEFPNNENEQQFLSIVEAIATVYDTLVSDVKGGKKTAQEANYIIDDLAIYVKKALDIDLKPIYSGMDENAIVEVDGGLPAGEAEFGAAKAMRQQLQAKTAAGTKAGNNADLRNDSERMKTLKSKTLPAVLAALGISLAGLGWLAQSDWMANFLMDIFGRGTEGADAITKTIDGGRPDSQGFIHWASKIMGKPITTGADVQEFVNTNGIENVQNMFTGNGGGTIQEQGQKLLQLIGGENAHKSVGQLFNAQTFGDMKMGRNLFGISKMAKFVSTQIVKEATKATAGAGAAAVATVAGLAPWLIGIGAGAAVAGALVVAFREKGKRQSRAKTLNDLYQSLQPLPIPENEVPLENISGIKNKDVEASGEAGGDADVAAIGKEKKARAPRKPIDADSLQRYITKLLVFMRQFEGAEPAAKPAAKPASGWNATSSVGDNFKQTNINTGADYKNDNQNRPNINYDYVKEEELDEAVLDEGRYITDKHLLDMLNEKLGTDKVKQFETFLVKLASVKNAIKKMPETADNKVNAALTKIKTNPIIGMNFRELFVSTTPIDNPNATAMANPNDSVLGLVTNALKEISSSRYKYAGIIDKINLMEAVAPVKPTDLTIRRTFAENISKFLGQIVILYQAISRMKKQIGTPAAEPTGGTPATEPTGETPAAEPRPKAKPSGGDSIVEAVNKMNEQAEKMRHLMNFNINAKRVL